MRTDALADGCKINPASSTAAIRGCGCRSGQRAVVWEQCLQTQQLDALEIHALIVHIHLRTATATLHSEPTRARSYASLAAHNMQAKAKRKKCPGAYE